ncbi:hypothetical protein BMS_1813 [Halobacteriovorax marinus SJ]|uniref:FAD dependent oxidoreductase domain-containing protein n=1 Tax=Halobacteriovorax marinus (strain ATCC BAA-682 / DSM 15412 / SJ) TaxID=862908 RepID=E1X1X6_HALMS|nr:FAD-dependent oxidoreductase [Halobacteriovorax marinus]CBW26636.1 hypothetical protein BMS_1813 [Halobacteriovorax marinus SJ]
MIEDIENYDLIIVGNGICAQSILFEIRKSPRFNLDTLKIAHVFNDKLLSPCSENTTSVVSLSGVSKGVSPLGDLIYDSYDYTAQLARLELSDYFHSASQYHIFEDDTNSDQFNKRYDLPRKHQLLEREFLAHKDECFVVDNTSLLKYLEELNSSLNLNKIQDTLVHIDDSRVIHLASGKKISAKKVILAMGAYSNHFLPSIEHAHLSYSKKVPGDYVSFTNLDLGKECFVLTKGHYNLVYRSFSKEVLIGGTTLKNDLSATEFMPLDELYQYFSKFIDDIPKLMSGEIRKGLRHKGRKRMPFLGEISSGIYSFHGVYKNGFTFSFYMANQFIRDFEL